jgi:molecular chaperone GrpE (heat shock protein)
MKNWVPSNLNDKEANTNQGNEVVLNLQKELQEARLKAASSEQAVERLSRDLENLRARQNELVKEEVASSVEALFSAAAAPAAQLAMQAYLIDQLQKPVQAKDIMVIARRLLRALEKNGLEFDGSPGHEIPFDPNLHIPLSGGQELVPGQSVVIRIPGVRYHGKLLARTGVDAKETSA